MTMNEKENLLSFIRIMMERTEAAKIYGEYWMFNDWKARRSHKAGELCQVMETIARMEAKAEHRPGSIGARKARQKAKAARRKLRDLERIIAEPMSEYRPARPGYITGSSKFITTDRPLRKKVRHHKDYRPPDFTID